MLAHDWLVGLRGGEFVLDRLARLAAELGEVCGLVTLFDEGRSMTPAIDRLPRFVSELGGIGSISRRGRRWMLPFYPAAVDRLSSRLADIHARQPFDLLVSTSSAAIKGLRAPSGVPHVCYCHSPARYLWTQAEAYSEGSVLRRMGLEIFGDVLREWDRATAANVDTFVANSEATRLAIREAWSRESAVVFPPVRSDFFVPPPLARPDEAPWLVVSALEPYKRVDLAIEAANLANHALVIAGDGSERERLEARCGPTVRMVGRVEDSELLRLYQTSRCLLFPQIEDFGIVAVEAQACGLPVVAFAGGGALETVIAGKTGSFFAEPCVESLLRAIAECPPPDRASMRDNAQRFSEVRFDHQMNAILTAALPRD